MGFLSWWAVTPVPRLPCGEGGTETILKAPTGKMRVGEVCIGRTRLVFTVQTRPVKKLPEGCVCVCVCVEDRNLTPILLLLLPLLTATVSYIYIYFPHLPFNVCIGILVFIWVFDCVY